MIPLSERIGECMRRHPEITQADIARACKVKSPSVADWLNGSTKSLKPEPARLGAALFGCDQNWLATGVGLPGWVDKSTPTPAPSNIDPGPDIRGRVPLISWVQAGSINGTGNPCELADCERWLECPVAHSGSTFAVRVRGDSMTAMHPGQRTYPEGCIIFVDPERRSPTNGQRVIARPDGSNEPTFKTYKAEDGRVWLQPINTTHQPITADFHVLGTVIGTWLDE